MNRKINIHNYEEIFLDYLDGALSDAEIVELENFLLEHPDLRKELEGMENVSLEGDITLFPVPENLKQIDLILPVGEENFDFFCIAYIEGDLNNSEKEEFESYIQKNPHKQKELEIISGARLSPDETILFNNKEGIKKSVFLIYKKEIRTIAAIAAGIALLLTFWFSFMDQDPEVNSLALSDEKEKQKTEIADSTSSAVESATVKDNKSEGGNEKLKNLEEKSKEAIKKAATKISFKVGIPIASADSDSILLPEEGESVAEKLVVRTSIDVRLLSSTTPLPEVQNDPLIPVMNYYSIPKKQAADPDEYLTLQEFAVQKLSDLIFRQEEKDLNAINLASAGIDKINSVAGTNMKLEASAKEETGEKVISFSSRIISFSTPINRED